MTFSLNHGFSESRLYKKQMYLLMNFFLFGKQEIPFESVGNAAERIQILDFDRTIRINRAEHALLIFFLRLGFKKGHRFPLSELLERTRRFDATDGRDKVFALLGLQKT